MILYHHDTSRIYTYRPVLAITKYHYGESYLSLIDLLGGRNSLGPTCRSREDKLEQEAGLASPDWPVLTVGPGTRLRGPTLAFACWWFSFCLGPSSGRP